MSWLLAIVTKALCGGAYFRIMADVTALVTGPSRERRHGGYLVLNFPAPS